MSEEFFGGEDCCIDVKVKMIYDGKKVMRSYVENEVYEATQQGRQDEKLETAKRLLKIGKLSLEDIANGTGLTIEEIEQLAK